MVSKNCGKNKNILCSSEWQVGMKEKKLLHTSLQAQTFVSSCAQQFMHCETMTATLSTAHHRFFTSAASDKAETDGA